MLATVGKEIRILTGLFSGVSLTKDLSLCCQRVRLAGVKSEWTVSALVPARVDACKVLTDVVDPGDPGCSSLSVPFPTAAAGLSA